MSYHLTKQMKQSFYDAKRRECGGLNEGDFWCYQVPRNASKTEQNASVCRLIPQMAWVLRNLSPYAEYFKRDKEKLIIGYDKSVGAALEPIFDCVMEYIHRGWLPADQSKWNDLMFKLMDEDTGNVFSEPIR